MLTLPRYPNSTTRSSQPRWGHTHIVETFVKDEVPLSNGFQPLDNVGTPKSRMPTVKWGKKSPGGFLNSLEALSPFSFISMSKHVITAKCYPVTTVLEVGPSPQYSIAKEWKRGWNSSLPPTYCLAEGLESSFPPSLAGATPPVLPRLCSAHELHVLVLL